MKNYILTLCALFGLTASAVAQRPQLSKEERYGKYSLQGYQSGYWAEPMAEFQKLENEGFYEASIALGQFAQLSDKAKAFEHFKKAATAGLAEAQWGCAGILGHEYIPDVKGKDKEWYRYCLAAAQGGCCDAMNELGNIYQRQDNYLAAFYWYQKATWYEHPQGAYGLGGILDKWAKAGKPSLDGNIDGVSQMESTIVERAMKIYSGDESYRPEYIKDLVHKATTEKSEFVPMFVAHLFEELIHNDTQAKNFYQVAGNNHSIMGMKCIGDMLAYGKGCQQDMDKAFAWYRAAAEANEKTACFIMGEYYRLKNKNLAAYWYTKSFRRGYAPALDRLRAL